MKETRSMDTKNNVYIEETDLKNIISHNQLFPMNSAHQLNLIDNDVKFGDVQSGSEICGYWNSNSLDILDRTISAQHNEGEIGASLKKGMNDYMDTCSNDSHNSYELFKTNYNNSASSHLSCVSKPTVKVLPNNSNRYCIQTNDNLNKPSFNYSENFGDFCPIKCQEQSNKVLVNISNTYSKVSLPTTSLHSAFIRKDNSERSTSRTFSSSSVIYDNNFKKIERPINVHIVRRNWNKNDAGPINQVPVLGHDHSSQLNISRNLLETNTWKPDQACLGQMNANQTCHGNLPVITLQKKEQQNMQCHENYKGDSSGSGNVIRVHSFKVGSGPSNNNSLPNNMKCCSPAPGGDLLFTNVNTNDNINVNSVKEVNENDKDQNKGHGMVECFNINPVGVNEEILRKIQLFSVVHKKLKWPCSFCGESHATRLSLTTHIKSHLLPWCRICLKIVNSDEQLLSHIEKKHSTSAVNVDQPETQLVTSKYGRKRRVYSPATLLPKRRLDIRK